MSFQAMAWASGVRPKSPLRKLLLFAIANYANDKLQCWPSHKKLATDTGMSEKSVGRHMAGLEGEGWITRKRRFDKKGNRTSDLITLLMPASPGDQQAESPVDQRTLCPAPKDSLSEEPITEPISKNSDEFLERRAREAPAFALTSPSERSPPSEKRASRLPEDWQPSHKDLAFARKQGLTEEEVSIETDQFKDHWRAEAGANAAKRDWAAAWRKWCRNAVKFRAGGGRAGRQSGGNGHQPASVVEAAVRAARRIQDA